MLIIKVRIGNQYNPQDGEMIWRKLLIMKVKHVSMTLTNKKFRFIRADCP
jgi:hypothetical protein